MSRLLYPNEYVIPGVYSQNISSETPTLNTIQLPVVIGRGSRYIEDQQVISRGFVFNEAVNVSNIYPNVFKTKFPILKDVKSIAVFKDEIKLPSDFWSLVDSFNIQLKEYDPSSHYSISYQSTSKEVDDKIDLDIVSFNSVGSSYASSNFEEFKNFYMKYTFSDIKKNNELNPSTIDFAPEYNNTHDYSELKNVESTFNIELIPESVPYNFKFDGFVSRVDYRDSRLMFIWIEFDYYFNGKKKHGFIKVSKNEYSTWNGIKFKLLSDDVIGKITTRNRIRIDTSDSPSTLSFNAFAPVKMVSGQNRTVTVNVMYRGNYEREYSIENVETAYDSCSYQINIPNPPSKNCHVNLATDDAYYVDSTLYLTFVLNDSFGNTEYKEARCVFNEGNISLAEDVELTLPNGISVYLYSNDPAASMTDDEDILTDDEGISFVGDSEESSFKISKKVVSFDYVTKPSFMPSVIDVTSTSSSATIRKEIDDPEEFIDLDGVYAKLHGYFEEGDVIQFNITQSGYISWNLTESVSESNCSVLTDYSGAMFGEYCAKYIQLKNEYVTGMQVKSEDIFDYQIKTIEGISYLIITKNGIPYEPISQVSLSYRSYTEQPIVGKTYYVNALCNRPDSLYNTLIEVCSLEEGRNLLGPFSSLNDLYIANEIAWREFDKPYHYAYVQVKDSDNDGVLSEDDIRVAFESLKKVKKGTDIVLLGNQQFINYLIEYNESQNNPFEKNENKIWLSTTDTEFVYSLSTREYPHLKNVIANRLARLKMIAFDNEVTINVTGSFIAWAFACVRNGIQESDTILRKPLKSFSYIEVYEDDINKHYGSNGMMFVISDSNYLIGEDCALKSTEQVANQQIISTKYISNKLDSDLIGSTFDSVSDSISAIQSKLIITLNDMINNGYISKYLDDNGNKRSIDASKDIFVKSISASSYQFGYGFYTKKGIKHLFGSYIMDSQFT